MNSPNDIDLQIQPFCQRLCYDFSYYCYDTPANWMFFLADAASSREGQNYGTAIEVDTESNQRVTNRHNDIQRCSLAYQRTERLFTDQLKFSTMEKGMRRREDDSQLDCHANERRAMDVIQKTSPLLDCNLGSRATDSGYWMSHGLYTRIRPCFSRSIPRGCFGRCMTYSWEAEDRMKEVENNRE